MSDGTQTGTKGRKAAPAGIQPPAAVRYLTAAETAAELRICPRLTYTLLRDGKLPGRKMGRVWRVSADALRRYVEGKGK